MEAAAGVEAVEFGIAVVEAAGAAVADSNRCNGAAAAAAEGGAGAGFAAPGLRCTPARGCLWLRVEASRACLACQFN